MRILFDVNHPAHVHFFRNPANKLRAEGHQVLFTSREKEFATTLLDEMGENHQVLSALAGGGLFGLAKELIQRNLALCRVVRQFRPHAMAAIGGTFIAHVGLITRTPSLVFYDTENAVLQNLITYPFASRVIVPRCYSGWLPRKHEKYAGYHELSYLHPKYFKPSRERAQTAGLDPEGDNFFIRLVSWQANHDVGEKGWDFRLLEYVVNRLTKVGKVMISSEAGLPREFQEYVYRGKVADVHHVLAFCSGFVGESATMASECAALGIPAVYAANVGRGYTDEQERRYDLVRNVRTLNRAELDNSVDWLLNSTRNDCAAKRARLLADTVDVAELVVQQIKRYARPE